MHKQIVQQPSLIVSFLCIAAVIFVAAFLAGITLVKFWSVVSNNSCTFHLQFTSCSFAFPGYCVWYHMACIWCPGKQIYRCYWFCLFFLVTLVNYIRWKSWSPLVWGMVNHPHWRNISFYSKNFWETCFLQRIEFLLYLWYFVTQCCQYESLFSSFVVQTWLWRWKWHWTLSYQSK